MMMIQNLSWLCGDHQEPISVLIKPSSMPSSSEADDQRPDLAYYRVFCSNATTYFLLFSLQKIVVFQIFFSVQSFFVCEADLYILMLYVR